MIVLYLKTLNKIIKSPDLELFNSLSLSDILWIDLISPSSKERVVIENFMHISLLTRQQAEEIESSSRYSESERSIVCNSGFSVLEDKGFKIEPVSFMIISSTLISERNCVLSTFSETSRKFQQSYRTYSTGFDILVSILEARVDLDADMIEVLSKQIATISTIHKTTDNSVDKDILLDISQLQENTMILRESIFDRQRLISSILRSERFPSDVYPHISIMLKDINSLLNHVDFAFERLAFLQDTFMGLVNIEQNKIIKMFTILSVIFMPPTLIASIYGMNFKMFPGLNWDLGYPFSIFLMVASIVLTLLFFKRKKWM